jgi:hypothetical protein
MLELHQNTPGLGFRSIDEATESPHTLHRYIPGKPLLGQLSSGNTLAKPGEKMPITAPVREKTYSLFDADLPLLAADAAAEIDLLTSCSSCGEAHKLTYTTELLARLKSIASTEEKFNVDRMLYERSLLPSVSAEEQVLFVEPSEVHRRLGDLIAKHELFPKAGDTEFLSRLKSFFLEVSSFASASRGMLRIGSVNTPYATL